MDEYRPFFLVPEPAGRELFDNVVVVVNCQADLAQVVQATRAAGRLAGRLHRRQEERDEYADDRNDNKQLHERKRTWPGVCQSERDWHSGNAFGKHYNLTTNCCLDAKLNELSQSGDSTRTTIRPP